MGSAKLCWHRIIHDAYRKNSGRLLARRCDWLLDLLRGYLRVSSALFNDRLEGPCKGANLHPVALTFLPGVFSDARGRPRPLFTEPVSVDLSCLAEPPLLRGLPRFPGVLGRMLAECPDKRVVFFGRASSSPSASAADAFNAEDVVSVLDGLEGRPRLRFSPGADSSVGSSLAMFALDAASGFFGGRTRAFGSDVVCWAFFPEPSLTALFPLATTSR